MLEMVAAEPIESDHCKGIVDAVPRMWQPNRLPWGGDEMITGVVLVVIAAALVALTWRAVSAAKSRQPQQLNREDGAAATAHTWVWSWIR
ncbi:hypothetical protein ACFXPS_16850 [Nocardia sp. NPDC059091]|uniref:hypothetical protein n=1 Tax=Nocardia sp. NPDC059091 TaxID=3346724 RepID=UPI0036C19AA7